MKRAKGISLSKMNKVIGAQEDTVGFIPELLPEYFLLGTLDDYFGPRIRYQNGPKSADEKLDEQFDQYYVDEDSLAMFISNYVIENFGEEMETSRRKVPFKFYSKKMAEMRRPFFTPDGYIVDSLFTDDKHLYSYLTGCFMRYGRTLTDEIYFIRLNNSGRKTGTVLSFLQRLDCRDVLYKCGGSTPRVHVFYFKPSPRLKAYFDLVAEPNAMQVRQRDADRDKMLRKPSEEERLERERRKQRWIEVLETALE